MNADPSLYLQMPKAQDLELKLLSHVRRWQLEITVFNSLNSQWLTGEQISYHSMKNEVSFALERNHLHREVVMKIFSQENLISS